MFVLPHVCANICLYVYVIVMTSLISLENQVAKMSGSKHLQVAKVLVAQGSI